MKRFLFAAALLLSLAAVSVSCTKEGPARFRGNYTFKTGGSLTVRPADDPEAESSTVYLADESGQMDVLVADKSSGSMIITMNALGGSVTTFDATADGSVLSIYPQSRRVSLSLLGSSDAVRPSVTVEVSGTGVRYDDVLILSLDYSGSYSLAGTEYEIIGSDIECVAKLN